MLQGQGGQCRGIGTIVRPLSLQTPKGSVTILISMLLDCNLHPLNSTVLPLSTLRGRILPGIACRDTYV